MSFDVTVRAITDTKEILNRARVTVWKDGLDKEPTVTFLEDMYKSEHSPIRDRWFVIEMRGIQSWLATHFVRHSIGYTPYVSTQRDDRLEYEGDRDDRRQGELVNMDITLNAQSWISVSRKRICGQAHPKAQKLWNTTLSKLEEVDKPLFNNCVPECVYRGFCPEKKHCGRTSIKLYKEWRKKYIGSRPVINIEPDSYKENGIIINGIYEDQITFIRFRVLTIVNSEFIIIQRINDNHIINMTLKNFIIERVQHPNPQVPPINRFILVDNLPIEE